MLIALAATLLLADAVAPVATPATKPRDEATQSDWVAPTVRAPGFPATPNLFRAELLGISGKAMISCVVVAQGKLEDCFLISDSPGVWGFGAEALRMAPKFQLNMTKRGGPAAGARILIPIEFPNTHKLNAEGITLVDHPIWSAAPSFDDVARAYPKTHFGVNGGVVLRCFVESDGRLDTCTAVASEPEGRFFRAGGSLIPKFRLRSDLAAPAATRLQVDVPIVFTNPRKSDPAHRHVDDPTWVVGADPARQAALFPRQASAAGVTSGLGVASCTVRTDGSLSDCRPDASVPPGLGFSEAAVQIAAEMKMNPWTDEGDPVDGATVTLPITFNRPEASKP